MTTRLIVNGIDKTFGDFQALSDVSFTIEPGQFVTLLGPSGCGKTTLLRVIAGFLEPEKGEILFGDKVMNDVPPNKRNTAMCFQSYALFPHKTVYENIIFGLRMRKVSADEQRKRVKEVMEMVDLVGLENRKPYELSGGQQQRVALARAIIVRPEILLFDEPLSNLDAKLREKVRVDIRNIQHSLGITTVYVTHDQAEALAISDVVIAMNKGRIVQKSDPKTIYNRPSTKFVADFIGSANITPGPCTEFAGSTAVVDSLYGVLRVQAADLTPGEEAFLCIRPEDFVPIFAENAPHAVNVVTGSVLHAVYMGNSLDLFVKVNDHVVRISAAKDCPIPEGSQISFTVQPDKICVMKG